MTLATGKRPCPHCGKEVSTRAKQCKHCFQFLAPTPQPFSAVPTEDERPTTLETELHASSLTSTIVNVSGAELTAFGPHAMKRYRDAYQIAHALNEQGQGIKVFAWVIASLIAFVGLVIAVAAAKQAELAAGAAILFAVIAAAITWSIIYGYGVRIAAEGQHLLASIDVAVHTSPFMSELEKAQAMKFL